LVGMGKKARLALIEVRLLADFPQLTSAPYKCTSRNTKNYNCLAWAAGDMTKRWDHPSQYYWPAGIDPDWTLENVMAVLATVGYQECTSFELEAGFEKVAIYTDQGSGMATHFARQLRNGRWTSKLGDLHDIEHLRLHQLEASTYGNATRVVKRKRAWWIREKMAALLRMMKHWRDLRI